VITREDRAATSLGRTLSRLAGWLLVALAIGACSGTPPEGVAALRTASFTGADIPAMREIALPHQRQPDQQRAEATFEYRLPLPALDPQRGLGVFITISNAPLAAFVNGMPVFENGDSRSTPISYGSSRASPWFRVSPTVLRGADDELTLRVHATPGSVGILGPVLVGEPDLVERWARREALLNHGLPVMVGAALLGVGLLSLSLWRGRRESQLFLLLASGTMLWGAQTLLQQLPSPPLPAPHNGVLIISLYVWYPMLLSVFFMRFSYNYSRRYEQAATVLVMVAAPALYLGVATGHFQTVSLALRALTLAGITVALLALLRYAWRERGVKSAVLLAAGALCVGFAMRDFAVSLMESSGRPLWLTGYSGLALIVVAGWMLVERYHLAYAATEASKAELESRVQAASAELARRLEQVQAARVQAEQASVAKSRFFAAASHDLRQPLHSLGLFAAALEGHVFSRDARDLVARIGDSIGALEALFDELLDLSKLDAGAVAVHPRNFALQDLFDRLSLEFHAEAVSRHLRMRFVPTSLAVRTDPVLLERVLANLVSNALRYTREGGVVIGARRRGLEVWLDVVDTGVGIPPEKQEQVFDEFFQIGNPGRDRRRGLGLGLAIVKRLTRLMGHRLTLQSIPGKGTRFRLTLLRAPCADALPSADLNVDLEPFAHRTALLVEDDPDIRLATINLLEQWGIAVTVCKSRDEVAELLDNGFRPDIALVDLRLETVDDGIDVIDLLRERLGSELPALLLSGDTGAAELARVRASGVALLTKPVAPARLKSALHAFLSGPAMRRPATAP
jgi:signal transduction histidine kinase/ActR/RegA family two-component response regulator